MCIFGKLDFTDLSDINTALQSNSHSLLSGKYTTSTLLSWLLLLFLPSTRFMVPEYTVVVVHSPACVFATKFPK